MILSFIFVRVHPYGVNDKLYAIGLRDVVGPFRMSQLFDMAPCFLAAVRYAPPEFGKGLHAKLCRMISLARIIEMHINKRGVDLHFIGQLVLGEHMLLRYLRLKFLAGWLCKRMPTFVTLPAHLFHPRPGITGITVPVY